MNYQYIELRKAYIDREIRGKTLGDLFKSSAERMIEMEPDEISPELKQEEIDLIQEQARAYCSLTLADQKEISELFQIHYPGEYTEFPSEEESSEWYQVSLVERDGSIKTYCLNKNNLSVYLRKTQTLGYTKVNNPVIENAVKSFYAQSNKLKELRQQEIMDCAEKAANGNEVLKSILAIHLEMENSVSVHPSLVETEETEKSPGLGDLPAQMHFYRVGRNASHDFSLGVHEGKIYCYSFGESDVCYEDKEGKTFSTEDIDWEKTSGYEGLTLDGTKVYERINYKGRITGPYNSLNEIGYIGHF